MGAIENQQLMPEQRGFSNNGANPTGPRKSNYGDDHMKKKSEDVAHGGDGIKAQRPSIEGQLGNSP